MRTLNSVATLSLSLSSLGLPLVLAAAGVSSFPVAAHAADPARPTATGQQGTSAPPAPGAAAGTSAAPPGGGTAAGAAGTGGTTATGGGATATWWGHAAFIINTPGGATIAIDPWLDNPSAPKGATQPTALDAILITHGHADHSGGAAQLAKKTGARVISPHELSSLLGADRSEGMAPGGSLKIKDATIHMVEAVHGSGYNADPKNVRYGGPPVGYVISIDKGPSIYHAGDTDAFSSMALIAERYHPTVALLPIGGHFTMDPAGAALAARLLKVKTVIPMHYGTFPMLTGTPAELRTELKKQRSNAKVLELKPGDTTKL